jgi:cathepsin F
MKGAILFVLVAIACVASASQFAVSDEIAQPQFEAFMRKFERTYAGVEAVHRYKIFKANLARAAELNVLDKGAHHGVTRFMDLTPEEFETSYLMNPIAASAIESLEEKRVALSSKPGDIPTSFDWRTKNAVTAVKNQAQCGSCWAFSATETIESAWFLAGNSLPTLGPQQLVDCDQECCQYDDQQVCDSGCEGGLPWNAYEYVIKFGGMDTELSYPYEAVDGSCRANTKNIAAKISNWTALTTDEDQIAADLFAHGPVSVAMNAGWLQTYIGGISDPIFCDPKKLDHAIQLVGYGVEGSKEFWIVRNSWGASWGEAGFFRLIKGKGKCGINTAATLPMV